MLNERRQMWMGGGGGGRTPYKLYWFDQQKMDSFDSFDRETSMFDREKIDSPDHHDRQPKFPYI